MSETKSIKLLHAADFHLDSPFDSLSAAEAAARRVEQRYMVHRIAEIAREEQVDAVLLAGDLLDSDSTYFETAETLVHELGEIAAPVFISPGNHDYYTPRSPYVKTEFPANVHIFKSPQLVPVSIPEKGVRIWGSAFNSPESPPMLASFNAPNDGDFLEIMLLHGEVARGDTRYNAITEDDIRRSGMNYIALGHIHAFSGLLRAGGTFYAWPGCPEGRGFDETGEKGIIVVDVSPEKCDLRFIPLGGRRYEILNVKVGDNALESLISALPDDTVNDIYRIILSGETEGVNISELESALTPKFYHFELRDRTTIRRDIWEKSGNEGLRGLFLTKLLEKYNFAKSDEECELCSEAAKWGLRAFDNADGA